MPTSSLATTSSTSLPAPSEEQLDAVTKFCGGLNVSVQAVAGAGKSTLLLHACARLAPDRVLIVAYNTALAADMNCALDAAGIRNARAFTFHALATRLFGELCCDDVTLHRVTHNAVVAREVRAALRALVDTIAEGSLAVEDGAGTDGAGTDGAVAAHCDPSGNDADDADDRILRAPHHLLIDEAQDMRELFWRLLDVSYDLRALHTLVVGDSEQELYGFEVDDPARSEFLSTPWEFFGNHPPSSPPISTWTGVRLSRSFRLTTQNAMVANAVKLGEPLTPGNGDGPLPMVITCASNEWATHVPPVVLTWLREFPPSRICILVRSVRTANASMRALTKALMRHRVPLYIHGVDAAHHEVRRHKVVIATHYAAKGLTFDAAVVLGVSDGYEANPLYVACSRARSRQLIVMEKYRPCSRLLRSMQTRSVRFVACAQTRAMLRKPVPPPSDDETTPGSHATPWQKKPHGPVDLTNWAVRGRAPRLHATVRHREVAANGSSTAGDVAALPMERLVGLQDVLHGGGVAGGELDGSDVWRKDDVADVHVLAAMMAREYEVSGSCMRLKQLLAPVRASRLERSQRASDRTRFIDSRDDEQDLLHPAVRRAMAEHFCIGAPVEDGVRGVASAWCAAAAASLAHGSYQHRALCLLCGGEHSGAHAGGGNPHVALWVDASMFEAVLSRLRAWVPSDAEYDGVIAADVPAPGEERLAAGAQVPAATVRCDALVGSDRGRCVAWTIAYCDHVDAALRLRACVPLALRSDLEEVRVLNVRTGELCACQLSDRLPLREMLLPSQNQCDPDTRSRKKSVLLLSKHESKPGP